MFAESILETSWTQRSQRSWTTLTSFGLQVAILGVLLSVPLLRTVGMPESRVLQPPVSWGAPPRPVRPVAGKHAATLNRSNLADNVVLEPASIPKHIKIMDEIEPPPQVSYNNLNVDSVTGNNSRDRVWKTFTDALSRVTPTVARPVSTKPTFRTSNILQGSLIRRVEPVYPPLARAVRIQGPVVLAAIISKAGTIEHLQVLSGHPMLVPAALQAVSQWRYRPYVLNGEVIEVETQITVNFKLNYLVWGNV